MKVLNVCTSTPIKTRELSRLFSKAFTVSALSAAGIAAVTNDYEKASALLYTSIGGGVLSGALNFVKLESPQKFNSNIEFSPAKSIYDARNFAGDNFRISDFDVEDIEIANWVNEGLTRINNRFLGRTYMPKKVKCLKNMRNMQASFNLYEDILNINSEIFSFPYIKKVLKRGEYFFNRKKHIENSFYEELKERFLLYKSSPEKFDKIDRFALSNGLINLSRYVSNINESQDLSFPMIESDRFYLINHECGHMFHYKTSKPIDILLNAQRLERYMYFVKYHKLQKASKKNFYEFIADFFAVAMTNPLYADFIDEFSNIKFPKITHEY